jgi:hypothetical protein
VKTGGWAIGLLSVFLTAAIGHAEAPVRSTLTLALTLNRTVLLGDRADERGIEKIRFTTKDYLALIGDSLGVQNLRSIVLERIADPADEVLEAAFLSEPLVLLDAAGQRVDGLGMLQQMPLPLESLGPNLNQTTSIAKRNASALMMTRTDIALEGTAWDLRHTSDDPVTLTLVGLTTAKSRRVSRGGVDLGLLFTGRTSEVNGGASFPLFNPHSADLIASGTITGTVKTGAERLLSAPR